MPIGERSAPQWTTKRDGVGRPVRSPPGRRRRGGFTLIETLLVLVVIGVLTTIAVPPVQRMRTAAALQNGRAQVSAALVLARGTATRWGRIAELHFDPGQDILSVRVDTVTVGSSTATVLIRQYRLRDDLGVDVRSDRDVLCFDATGVGTTGPSCPVAGATVVIRAGARADTLRINSVGRVWR